LRIDAIRGDLAFVVHRLISQAVGGFRADAARGAATAGAASIGMGSNRAGRRGDQQHREGGEFVHGLGHFLFAKTTSAATQNGSVARARTIHTNLADKCALCKCEKQKSCPKANASNDFSSIRFFEVPARFRRPQNGGPSRKVLAGLLLTKALFLTGKA
jgi:hypothetical protein